MKLSRWDEAVAQLINGESTATRMTLAEVYPRLLKTEAARRSNSASGSVYSSGKAAVSFRAICSTFKSLSEACYVDRVAAAVCLPLLGNMAWAGTREWGGPTGQTRF